MTFCKSSNSRASRQFSQAGNGGDRNLRLGSQGIYVGATDRRGKLWKHSSPNCDLLAPGASLVCCQPSVAQLRRRSLGVYSGTSLAAPIVGAVACLLHGLTKAPPAECLEALCSTSRDTAIDPKLPLRAFNWR